MINAIADCIESAQDHASCQLRVRAGANVQLHLSLGSCLTAQNAL